MRRFFDTLALLLAAAAAGCSPTPPADYPPAAEPAIAEAAPAPAAAPAPGATQETAPGGDPADAGGADDAADDAPAAAPVKRAGKAEPAQAAAEITGTLVGRNGNEVTVELSAAGDRQSKRLLDCQETSAPPASVDRTPPMRSRSRDDIPANSRGLSPSS